MNDVRHWLTGLGIALILLGVAILAYNLPEIVGACYAAERGALTAVAVCLVAGVFLYQAGRRRRPPSGADRP